MARLKEMEMEKAEERRRKREATKSGEVGLTFADVKAAREALSSKPRVAGARAASREAAANGKKRAGSGAGGGPGVVGSGMASSCTASGGQDLPSSDEMTASWIPLASMAASEALAATTSEHELEPERLVPRKNSSPPTESKWTKMVARDEAVNRILMKSSRTLTGGLIGFTGEG